jgi:enamine deaminase RidA (YjgF/YER057c/UK114 family)
MKKEIIPQPKGAPNPIGPPGYPQAVKAGNWIFMTLAKPGLTSFEEQFTAILEEIKTTLESLGSSMGDIVQMHTFFVDLKRDAAKAGPIWLKYLPEGKWPVGAWVGIKELMPVEPPLLVEVACSAIIPDE